MPNEARRLQPEQCAPQTPPRPQTTIFLFRFPKQILIFTAIFFISAFCAFSQEAENDQSENIEQVWLNEQDETDKKVAIGLGLEWNFNSREGFAGGASLGFGVDLPYSFATGASFTASYNFDNIVVLEPSAFFRWYFISMGEQEHSNFFVQADLGAFLSLEDGEVTPVFTGGLRAGYRLPLGSFYIEPYGRFGYPYMFGVGLAAGVKF